MRKMWDEVLSGAVWRGELTNRRKDGSFYVEEMTITPVRSVDGSIGHFIAVKENITERKLAEEALIRGEKLAALGRMAATIAHEVNNPLAAVMNSIFIANSDPALTPETREVLKLADQELRRAAHITAQTLVFCRETGSRTAIRLPQVVDDVLVVYERKLVERGITVHRRQRCGPCQGNCDFCLAGNAGELRQVVSNLLGNAIDALQDNGTLHIRLLRISSVWGGVPKVRLTIADNGHGIRSENLRRVFEPFFTTKESLGTGLGLWVTEQIVRKYGGFIRVRSQANRGTVFQIALPATPVGSRVIT